MTKRWLTRDIRLFSGLPQSDNFRDLLTIYPVRVAPRSRLHRPLAVVASIELPETYDFGGEARSTRDFLAATETSGLLVLRDGEAVYERYDDPLGPSIPWPCWSVTKSFVSTLVGVAIAEGLVPGVDAIVSDLAPILAGSAYDGVRLSDVLTMSSGARWYENYADAEADNRRHGQVHATGGSLDAFAATLPREWAPGTRLRYNSIDTNVLGLVLRRATQRNLTDLFREWLWEPMGAEHEAFFIIDGEGAEWAGAGLICTLRDRARLGLLLANQGRIEDRSLVPAAWLDEATTPQSPHLVEDASPAQPFGYGYQWWLHRGAVSAIGIYNQYVWVDPTRRLVIAKASANRHYGRSFDEAGYRDQEHMALFSAIAARNVE